MVRCRFGLSYSAYIFLKIRRCLRAWLKSTHWHRRPPLPNRVDNVTFRNHTSDRSSLNSSPHFNERRFNYWQGICVPWPKASDSMSDRIFASRLRLMGIYYYRRHCLGGLDHMNQI